MIDLPTERKDGSRDTDDTEEKRDGETCPSMDEVDDVAQCGLLLHDEPFLGALKPHLDCGQNTDGSSGHALSGIHVREVPTVEEVSDVDLS